MNGWSVQALTHFSAQWHRFFIDIPYEEILAPGIYLWRPKELENPDNPYLPSRGVTVMHTKFHEAHT